MAIRRLSSKAKPFAALRPVGLKLIGLRFVLEGNNLDLMISGRIRTQGNGIGIVYSRRFDKFKKCTKKSVLLGIGIQIEL